MKPLLALWLRALPRVLFPSFASLGLGAVSALGTVASLVYEPRPATVMLANLHVLLGLAMPIAFAAGHAVVTPDFRDGTVRFLDGLPTTRAHRFLAAVLTAALPWALAVVAIVGPRALGAGIAHEAGDALLFALVADVTAVTGAFLLACLGIGLLFSWLGELGWIAWIGALGFFVVATEYSRTYAHLWPRSTAAIIDFVQGAPVLPTYLLASWLAIFAVTTLSSLAIYLGPGDLLLEEGSRVRDRMRVLAYVALYGLAALSLGRAASNLPKVWTRPEPTEVVTAGENRVKYTHDNADAQAVVAHVDAVSEQVRTALDAPKRAFDIQMMGADAQHAGLYELGRVRLDPHADLHTLAHELTHAYANVLAGSGMNHTFDAARFFQEGLATYVADQLYPRGPPEPIGARIGPLVPTLGTLAATGQADFDDLIDDAARTEAYDRNQVYPLGKAFVGALIAEAGPAAPHCVLVAMRGLSSHTAGIAVWDRVSDTCNFSLDAVVDRYEADLAAETGLRPRVRWYVAPDDEGLWIHPTEVSGLPVTGGMIRDCGDGDEKHEKYVHIDDDDPKDVRARVPESRLAGRCYDLRFRVGDDPTAVELPWSQDHHLPPTGW